MSFTESRPTEHLLLLFLCTWEASISELLSRVAMSVLCGGGGGSLSTLYLSGAQLDIFWHLAQQCDFFHALG